jgi:predicted ATPase
VASSFVGRDLDVAAIAERFERSRLVTLVGPGGMGKTRLAIRFAMTHVATYTAHGGGGAWFCDCTEACGLSGITAAVAHALRVRLPPGTTDADLVERLGAAIGRSGPVLLVLDNLEHLVEPAATAIGRWLSEAPHAKFLATSRVSLGVPGEDLWPLGPLGPEYAAELFRQRARQVQPEGGGPDEQAIVSHIVHVLGGMPLAIELAASRMAIMSPAQLRARLDRPLDVLASVNPVGRHASLRQTIVDSVQLLSPADRHVFATCAIFDGGFTLEAAEAVLEGTGARDVSAALERLVRHSLLRVSRVPDRQELRFSFFETIREVARELLDGNPARQSLAAHHASFYASVARKLGAPATLRAGGEESLRITMDLDNLVAAHAHALAAADADRVFVGHALAISLGLEPVLSARGQSRLRLRLLSDAIEKARAHPVDRRALAEALLAHGMARRELGEMTLARTSFEEALDLATATGTPILAALAHARIGDIVEIAGATADAHVHFAESLALLTTAPKGALRDLYEAETYMRIGHAYRREGDLRAAERAVAEATLRYRRLGHDEGLAGALYEGAVIAMFEGRSDASLERFAEGLESAERGGARAVSAALTTARGGLLQEMGKLDEALAHHAAAARVFSELGSRYRETSALYYLATAYLERGDTREADAFLGQALERVRGVSSPRYEALIEGCRSVSLARRGDLAGAALAAERAEAARALCATEPALAATLAIHRITRAILSREEGTGGEAERDARAMAEAHPSDDSRFALRMLLACLHGSEPEEPVALVVWEGGRAFQVPYGDGPVDLSRRAPIRRILELLARRRYDAPGEGVPVHEIVGAGWPGEKISPSAALNRAYVAVATLRKLGLRDLIFSGPSGYSLTPAVVVRFAPAGERATAARVALRP